MIRPKKVVETSPSNEEFRQWEWGDADLAPFLTHIRADTARVIANQIVECCEGRINESNGAFRFFPFGLDCDFVVEFDVLQALAVGQIEFEDLGTLKDFAARIAKISDNLNEAIKVAEGSEPA